MPSGKTHDRITLIACLPVSAAGGVLAYWLNAPEVPAVLTASFVFGGFMFSPDLDCRSYPYYRWGWFRWIWVPYQRLIPRHRSVWSHGFVVGTALRLLYLFAWIGLAVLGNFAVHILWVTRQEFAIVLAASDWGTVVALVGGVGSRAIAEWWEWMRWVQSGIVHHSDIAIAIFTGLELGAASHYCADWIGSAWKRWQRRRVS